MSFGSSHNRKSQWLKQQCFKLQQNHGALIIASASVALGIFFKANPAMSRWMPYVSAVFLSIFTIILSARDNPTDETESRKIGFFLWILMSMTAGYYIFEATNLYVQGKGAETTLFLSNKSIFIVVVFLCLPIFVGHVLGRDKSQTVGLPEHFKTAVFIALGVLIILQTQTGDSLRKIDFENPALSVSLLWILSFSGFKYLRHNTHTRTDPPIDRPKRLALVFMAAIAAYLSCRTDGLATDGSRFHIGYFSGVVQTIRSGGTLLWDTPSQYGLLNTLVPSLLPIQNSINAVVWFQILMFLIVSLSILLYFYVNTNNAKEFSVLAAPFLVLFFFADPALIGPQAFPSSSVLRFGPSTLCLIWIAVLLGKKAIAPTLTSRLLTGFLFAVSFFWSFESLYYTAVMILFTGAGVWVQSEETRRATISNIRPYIVTFLKIVLGSLATISIFIYLRVGHIPDYQLFITAANNYAAGFGAFPLRLISIQWVYFAGIAFGLLAFTKKADLKGNDGPLPIISSAIGCLMAWISYYVGRAHSNNVIAVYPLFFVALIVIIKSAEHSRKSTSVSETLVQDIGSVSSPRYVERSKLLLVVFSTLVLVSILGGSKFSETIAKIKTAPKVIQFQPESVADSELVKELLELEITGRPAIAYHGWLGVLPTMPREISQKYDLELTWLPLPLGLLEEPTSLSLRSKLLGRYSAQTEKSGLIIWDKKRSFTDRFPVWINSLSKYYVCSLKIDNDAYQIQQCEYRS